MSMAEQKMGSFRIKTVSSFRFSDLLLTFNNFFSPLKRGSSDDDKMNRKCVKNKQFKLQLSQSISVVVDQYCYLPDTYENFETGK